MTNQLKLSVIGLSLLSFASIANADSLTGFYRRGESIQDLRGAEWKTSFDRREIGITIGRETYIGTHNVRGDLYNDYSGEIRISLNQMNSEKFRGNAVLRLNRGEIEFLSIDGEFGREIYSVRGVNPTRRIGMDQSVEFWTDSTLSGDRNSRVRNVKFQYRSDNRFWMEGDTQNGRFTAEGFWFDESRSGKFPNKVYLTKFSEPGKGNGEGNGSVTFRGVRDIDPHRSNFDDIDGLDLRFDKFGVRYDVRLSGALESSRFANNGNFGNTGQSFQLNQTFRTDDKVEWTEFRDGREVRKLRYNDSEIRVSLQRDGRGAIYINSAREPGTISFDWRWDGKRVNLSSRDRNVRLSGWIDLSKDQRNVERVNVNSTESRNNTYSSRIVIDARPDDRFSGGYRPGTGEVGGPIQLPQGFKLDTAEKGEGRMQIGGQRENKSVNQVKVRLTTDGKAYIEVRADRIYRFEGTWSRGRNLTINLRLNEMDNRRGSATGVVEITRERKTFSAISFQGSFGESIRVDFQDN